MRIALLLLVFSCIFAGEATQPLPNVAKQVSDVLQARYEATRKADLAATKELRKLFIKYRDVVKNQRPTLIAISIALNKIDPNDGEVILVLKDVPADQRDLLGDSTEPGKYLTEVQAKFYSDALMKGKFTAKDWDALPGKVIEVGYTTEALVSFQGKTIALIPNPEDKWKRNEESKWTIWSGDEAGEMKLQLKILKDGADARIFPVTKIVKIGADESIKLGASSGGSTVATLKGKIRVKVYEVVPVE